jgi:16S rRNA (guanine527-N7)-methyltransferase
VLLEHWHEARAVLLDSRRRSGEFLRVAVEDLDLGSRVEVVEGRAEVEARTPALRAGFDLVVARSFGPPAVTAECAVGFLEPGGTLLVAEPPDPEPGRWPTDGLAQLGLARLDLVREGGFGVARLRAPDDAGERWPRRAPAKRPLWG